MLKKKQRIPVEERSPPPWESDSEPDSEAISRRRRREGFPFPEAVTLLENFLKDANEIEETDKLYTRPGKALTMEEISTLDRKMLGISAIIRKVGDKMKKLEEDSWREMKEILEGGGMETERDEKKLSYLLAILKPSCDASPLIDFLKTNESPFQIDPTFDALAPFAKSCAVKQEKTTEIQEKETDVNMDGNTVPPSSENPLTSDLRRQVVHKEASEGDAVAAQPKDSMGEKEQTQLGLGRNKKGGHREVKKEVKEEVKDEETDERGGPIAKDKPTGGVKEASKRKEKEKSREKGTTGGMVKSRKEQPSEVIVKEEMEEEGTGDDVMPLEQVRVEEEGAEETQEPTAQIDEIGIFWSGGRPIHAPKRRKLDLAKEMGQNEVDIRQNEAGFKSFVRIEKVFQVDPPLGEMGPPLGELDPNDGIGQRGEEDLGEEKEEQFERRRKSNRVIKPKKFFGDFIDYGGEEQEKRKNCQKEEKGEPTKRRKTVSSQNEGGDSVEDVEEDGVHREEEHKHDDDTMDGGFGGMDDYNNEAERPPEEESLVERKRRMTAKHHVEKGSELDDSDEDGDKIERLRSSGISASNDGALEEEQEDEEMEETADEEDSVDNVKKCPVDGCIEKFDSSRDLVKHMSKHQWPMPCGMCKRSCPNGSKLPQHYVIHTGEKPFKCEICGFRTRRSSGLKKHKRVHTGERPYFCTICNKRFADSSTLASHIRTHSGVRPYECDICGFKTAKFSHLKEHQRTHTGEKPYACTVCDKHFAHTHTFNMHMRTHTGERPHECDICGFKAVQISHLKTHNRIHTGERPYSCGMCDYKAKQHYNFKIHQHTHTKEKPFSCTCGYKSSNRSNLNKHKKRFSH